MSQSWPTLLKAEVKQVLYRWGAFGAMHRRRNRETLTVLMFHRVIAPGAPAWPGANPLFTMSTGFFAQLLSFIKHHYTPVGLEAVARAQGGEKPLPPRALLVTFDDGWADNAEFAVPLLKEAGVPAVFFVATGAVKSGLAFWQERLFAAAVSAGPQDAVWKTVVGTPTGAANFQAEVMGVISRLERQGAKAGPEVLQRLMERSDAVMPQMMTPGDITRLAEEPLFDFGTHGISHTPFSDLTDPAAELTGSWEDLSNWCAPSVQSLSFPHGRYTLDILALAKTSGYELIFDSEKHLCHTGSLMASSPLGRFEVRPPGSDPDNLYGGRCGPDDFDSGRIASEMFLRPIHALPRALPGPGSEELKTL